MKANGTPISMLTAYDYTFAQWIDRAGIDIILVGDSASNVMAGNATTLSITLPEMIYHGRSVVRAVKRAFVVVDMPFGTVAGNPMVSLDNAIKMMQQTGADAIKVEGGREIIDDIKKIIGAGIPVMGHLGLMPQSVNKYGGYAIRGKDVAEQEKILEDSMMLHQAGCFAIVLEKIPTSLAEKISRHIPIPIIGIGAGASVDGQVLVSQDMLGMNDGFSPKFLRKYADVGNTIKEAVQAYIHDVKKGDFPNSSESYL